MKTNLYLFIVTVAIISAGCQQTKLPVYETFPIKNAVLAKLAPVKESIIPDIAYIHLFDGRSGLKSFLFNDWLISRSNIGYFNTRKKPIRLESDTAVEYICRQRGVAKTNCAWFAIFYSHNMKILATKRFPVSLLHKIPDLEKSVDNNGKLLKNSRPPFFKSLIYDNP